jgi:flagellin
VRKYLFIPAITVLFSFSSPLRTAAAEINFLFIPDGANFCVYGSGPDHFIITQNRFAELRIDRLISQLSSGKRINNASDDPSGLAVSEKMSALINQMKRESVNDEDLKNLYSYAESVAGLDQEIVKKIRGLIVRASDGILSSDDREIIQVEIDELIRQIDMNAEFSKFNAVSVIPQLTSRNLGIDAVDVVRDPEGAIGIADAVLSGLNKKRVLQGVKSNILTFRIEGKSINVLNLQRSESSIRDLEMAEGAVDLVKNCVLLKSGNNLIARPK